MRFTAKRLHDFLTANGKHEEWRKSDNAWFADAGQWARERAWDGMASDTASVIAAMPACTWTGKRMESALHLGE